MKTSELASMHCSCRKRKEMTNTTDDSDMKMTRFRQGVWFVNDMSGVIFIPIHLYLCVLPCTTINRFFSKVQLYI